MAFVTILSLICVNLPHSKINYLCINYTIIYYEAMRPPKSYFLSEGCVDHTMSNHVTVTLVLANFPF